MVVLRKQLPCPNSSSSATASTEESKKDYNKTIANGMTERKSSLCKVMAYTDESSHPLFQSEDLRKNLTRKKSNNS